jgi:heat shock protein HtpX
MPATAITITPRRSVALFALLAMGMVLLSYAVVLATAGLCVYLPYLAVTGMQSLHIQIIFLLIGGVVIAGTILFSIIPRRDEFTAAGPLLERSAHPRLFAELDFIAEVLREPLPREVYLIGDVNAYVGDRGGLLGFGSRRIMGLGLPLLSALSVSEFRAILAHEFAHYYGGDTTLGPWIYKTQTAVARTFRNISSLAESTALPHMFRLMQTLVTYLLSWYFIFFMRVIHFVYRKNEFRADEIAALLAGSEPLSKGLRTIHRADPLWAAYWHSEVSPVIKHGSIPPLCEGFTRFLAAPHIAALADTIISQEIAEPKSEPFDSHPPLKQRLEALEKTPSPDLTPDASPALSLLENPAAVELQFVETMNSQIPKSSLRRVAWDQVGAQVLIPSWRAAVADHTYFLEGYTVEQLPGATRDISQLAYKIKNPKGVLLSQDDRFERAAQLLAIAAALCLIESGWELKSGPGFCYLQRGDHTIEVFTVLHDLRSGELSPEAWAKTSRELGIAEFRLASSTPQQVSTPN